MPALVEKITPGRARVGDSVSIVGSSFSATPGRNRVFFDGVAAVLTLETAVQIDATIPVAGLPLDGFSVVTVENLDDLGVFTWWIWGKDSVASLATPFFPFKKPWRDEIEKGLGNADNLVAESKFFERLIEALLLLPSDLVNALGSLATMSSTGLRQVSPGALGEALSSFPSGAEFLARESASLVWGRELAAATVAATLMEAGAIDTTQAINATEEVVAKAGRIASVSVFCSAAGFSRVELIEVLVNGAVVHTEDLLVTIGLGLGAGQSTTFGLVSGAVSQGDRVEVRLTKPNASAVWSGRAIAQVI